MESENIKLSSEDDDDEEFIEVPGEPSQDVVEVVIDDPPVKKEFVDVPGESSQNLDEIVIDDPPVQIDLIGVPGEPSGNMDEIVIDDPTVQNEFINVPGETSENVDEIVIDDFVQNELIDVSGEPSQNVDEIVIVDPVQNDVECIVKQDLKHHMSAEKDLELSPSTVPQASTNAKPEKSSTKKKNIVLGQRRKKDCNNSKSGLNLKTKKKKFRCFNKRPGLLSSRSDYKKVLLDKVENNYSGVEEKVENHTEIIGYSDNIGESSKRNLKLDMKHGPLLPVIYRCDEPNSPRKTSYEEEDRDKKYVAIKQDLKYHTNAEKDFQQSPATASLTPINAEPEKSIKKKKIELERGSNDLRLKIKKRELSDIHNRQQLPSSSHEIRNGRVDCEKVFSEDEEINDYSSQKEMVREGKEPERIDSSDEDIEENFLRNIKLNMKRRPLQPVVYQCDDQDSHIKPSYEVEDEDKKLVAVKEDPKYLTYAEKTPHTYVEQSSSMVSSAPKLLIPGKSSKKIVKLRQESKKDCNHCDSESERLKIRKRKLSYVDNRLQLPSTYSSKMKNYSADYKKGYVDEIDYSSNKKRVRKGRDTERRDCESRRPEMKIKTYFISKPNRSTSSCSGYKIGYSDDDSDESIVRNITLDMKPGPLLPDIYGFDNPFPQKLIMGSEIQETQWLYDLLLEVQLEHFYLKIRNDLQVTRLNHFEYVVSADLENIGMGKPAARRLLDAASLRMNSPAACRKSIISKFVNRCPNPTPGSCRIEVNERAKIQPFLDRTLTSPCPGLENVVEIQGIMETSYYCKLCDAPCNVNSLRSHLSGFKHQLNSLRLFRRDLYESWFYKHKYEIEEDLLRRLAKIERREGRGEVTVEREFFPETEGSRPLPSKKPRLDLPSKSRLEYEPSPRNHRSDLLRASHYDYEPSRKRCLDLLRPSHHDEPSSRNHRLDMPHPSRRDHDPSRNHRLDMPHTSRHDYEPSLRKRELDLTSASPCDYDHSSKKYCPDLPSMNHPDDYDLRKKLSSRCSRSSSRQPETDTSHQNPEHFRYEELSRPDLSKPGFYCKLCDSHSNSNMMWQNHITGKRHLANMKKAPGATPSKIKYIPASNAQPYLFDYLEKENTENLPVVGLSVIREIRKPIINGVSFNCFLCNAYVSRLDIVSHVLSLKHREKYLEKINHPELLTLRHCQISERCAESIITEICAKVEDEEGPGTPEVCFDKSAVQRTE